MNSGQKSAMANFGKSNAGVPTQSYGAQNFVGTPTPVIGTVGVTPNGNNTSGNTNRMQTAVVVAVLVLAGYAGYHYLFEK